MALLQNPPKVIVRYYPTIASILDLDQLYGRSGFYSFKYRLRHIKSKYEQDEKSVFSWNYRRVKFERFLGGKKS